MKVMGIGDYWPMRWRCQHGLVHYSDAVNTRCRQEIPYQDLRDGTSWRPTGMPQDAITCIRCLCIIERRG